MIRLQTFFSGRLRWLAVFVGAGAASLAGQTAPAEPAAAKEKEGETQQLAPVEVTGSRIKRVELEGTSPIKILSRQDLEHSGRASLADALQQMPEAGFATVNESGTTSAVRGSSALNLRDLGANNTLVLINGRRAVLTGQGDLRGTAFVDLNRFPIVLVGRGEGLKDGASAIYGADATAGVVNVILRKDFKGAEVDVNFGTSRGAKTGEKNVSLFFGTAAGKVSATIGLSFYQRGGLRAIDTDYAANADLSARYLAKDPQYADRVAAGFYDLRSGTGPQARINGVVGPPVNGRNGVNIPGLPANFQITRLPGTGGVASGLGTVATPSFTNPPVEGTGGQYSAAITATYVPQQLTPQSNPSNLYNFQQWVWLVPEVSRLGLATAFRYDVTKNLNIYAEFSYSRNKSHTEFAPPPITTVDDNQIFVPRTNYWNPFGVDVQFAWRPVDFGPRKADVFAETAQALVGARGRLRDRWDWDVGYTHGDDRHEDRSSNMISESRLRAVLDRSTPNALNIFGGAGFKNDPAVYNEIRVTTENGGHSGLSLGDAKIAGDLFDLPTGTVGVAGYAEWRKEIFGERNDALSSTLNDIIAQVRTDEPSDARRTVGSVAAELRVPLMKPADRRFLRKADLSLAARFENFSDGYDSGVKPYFGLRLQPFRDLVLRGSMTKAFRAPTLLQLYGGVREALQNNLPDYRRPQALTGDPFDGVATERLVRASGNRDLTPENAEIFQYGFVYDVPLKFLKGLTLGATFFHYDQRNVITSLGADYIRRNEVGGGTGSLVVREPTQEFYTNRSGSPIPILVAPSQVGYLLPGQSYIVPGRIRYIQDRVVNLARQKVEGYDFEINYARQSPSYGRFSFRAAATYLSFFDYSPDEELTNQLGRSGLPWVRMQASLVWNRQEWTAGLVQNYNGRYGNFERDGFAVDAYLATGIFVGYDIPAGRIRWVENTRLSFGLDNAFGAKPPLFNDSVGYDQRFISRPDGRFWFVGLRRAY